MIELNRSSLKFTFPEVHPKAELSIEFQRTLRIPDDDNVYPLPPGLGNFPLQRLSYCEEDGEPLLCLSSEMGLAPGGKMRQEIYEDPFGINDWGHSTSSRCFFHIANSLGQLHTRRGYGAIKKCSLPYKLTFFPLPLPPETKPRLVKNIQ